MNKYLLSLIMLTLAFPSNSAPAQSLNAETRTLLTKVSTAYRNISTLSETIEKSYPYDESSHIINSRVIIKKPLMIYSEITYDKLILHVVADGKNIFRDSSDEKSKYSKQSYTRFEDAVEALKNVGGVGIGILARLLTLPEAENRIIPGRLYSLKPMPDEIINNDNCDVVEALIDKGDDASRFLLWFGKEDHLLRKRSYGPVIAGCFTTIVEIYRDVNLHPIFTDKTFQYTPANGAFVVAPPEEPAQFDRRLKVGAAPLAITGKDLEGKKVSLDQYKGKVLLIDFWATWCGPCVAELPNVIDVYGKYHAKGFEILGISLDQENALPKLKSFIKAKNMKWRQIYDGKFWDADNAVTFSVRAIPFTLLIGRDGKLAAVGTSGNAFALAMQTALNKK